MCAKGGTYSIYVRPGSSGNIVLDFLGGGACWNGANCTGNTISFTDHLDDLRDKYLPSAAGLYEHDNPENPVRLDTHVVIPYCTGDVHWGHADRNYIGKDGKEFTIHHRGAINAQAAIDKIKSDYGGPGNILVTGCSAGSYASIYWTPYIKRMWPHSHVSQFGDSGAGVLTESFQHDGFLQWNVVQHAPAWIPGLDPAQVDWYNISMHDMYKAVAKAHPEISFGQFNAVDDLIQKYFYRLMGGDTAAWTALMRQQVTKISEGAKNFSYYMAPFDGHCITPFHEFYDDPQAGNNRPLKSWFTALMKDERPANENCDHCESP